MDTLTYKIQVFESLAEAYPHLVQMVIWEDREEHVHRFRELGKKYPQLQWVVHHVMEDSKSLPKAPDIPDWTIPIWTILDQHSHLFRLLGASDEMKLEGSQHEEPEDVHLSEGGSVEDETNEALIQSVGCRSSSDAKNIECRAPVFSCERYAASMLSISFLLFGCVPYVG